MNDRGRLKKKLRREVERLGDRVELLERANKNLLSCLDSTDADLTRWGTECQDDMRSLSDRINRVEDRLSPPEEQPHGLDSDCNCADCDGPASEPVMPMQDRIDLIARWMHPGLWGTLDGRREAILKILGGEKVEPPLSGRGISYE